MQPGRTPTPAPQRSAHRVAGRVRERARLFVLSVRDLLASAGPVAFLAAALLIAAYLWLDPQPPRRVVLATGPVGSAYDEFARRYADALRPHGIAVDARATAGSAENLELLRAGQVDVAFVRGGGLSETDDDAGLLSLGALFYEPLWLFVRQGALPRGQRPVALSQLRGLRLAADGPGSGVPAIAEALLRANGLAPGAVTLTTPGQAAAADALLAGRVDAIVFASAPESPLVQRLLRAPGVALMDWAQADAYGRRFAYLQPATLPRGVVDLAGDVPPADVSLLVATTSLLARDATHSALRQLFAQSAQKIHGNAGWFNGARDFPNTKTSELPVSPEGDRAINGTPPFWQRYLPFWASNLIERMWLVIGGLLVLMLPLSRIVPPLYTFRVRRRVFRWYARLREIEAELAEGRGTREGQLDELDELDRVVHNVAVPLAHAGELYALRDHIHAVRKRVLARQAGDGNAAAEARVA